MRVNLGGQGGSIPEQALPVSEIDEEGGFWLTMSDGSEFKRQDWIDQGFTHYDVYCVGGAGGQGATPAVPYRFLTGEFTYRTMPEDVWQAHLTRLRILDRSTAGEWDHLYAWGDSPTPETVVQHEIRINPTKRAYFRKYSSETLRSGRRNTGTSLAENPFLGGAGGGGGMERVSGRLDLLPEIVAVTVGAAGIDAPDAQEVINGMYTPDLPPEYQPFAPNPSQADAPPYYTAAQITADNQLSHEWVASFIDEDWPVERRLGPFPPLQPGGDGGTSSFGMLCKASGGKGGQSGKIWQSGVLVDGGSGGEGGLGGRTEAGGGAAGSTALPNNGESGTWDGHIASGGGGGHAGSTILVPPPGGFGPPSTHFLDATDGGRGAYAFSDPSIFGEPGRASGLQFVKLTFDNVTGELVSEVAQPPDLSRIFTPGQGGGVRPKDTFAFGSRGGAGSPSGAVLIRLSTVE